MNLYKVKKIRVIPKLPEKLGFLKELAYNIYWSWDPNSRALFRRLDPELWEEVNRNPVLLLGSLSQERLEEMAENEGYLASMARVRDAFENYMTRKTWFQEHFGAIPAFQIAYFSMEYGLASSLPVYSGGLGVLSGDHLKSAGDLGLPFVAVGLAYQQGYFQQYLASDGWQQETYPVNDFYNLPLVLQKDDKGNPLLIYVDFPGRKVFAQIWRLSVGRVPLYLLDANIAQNDEDDRQITAHLYGGDNDMRIKQEILLGIGGMRALTTLGIRPDVCHMNEGHSAFLALERIRTYLEANPGTDFTQAYEATRVGNVFTTHTPVPAGIDQFEVGLVEHYLKDFCSIIQLSSEQLLKFGGKDFHQTEGKFNMAIFAINMAGGCNGVSRLHGRVSRAMWNYLWPNFTESEAPIGYVTNGVHIRTWISSEISELYSRYLHPNWYRNPADESMWGRITQIPDVELWRTHERRRERLVSFARRRLQDRLKRLGAPPTDINRAAEVLRPDALTLGFARRFASYKRAYLLFSDIERLRKILNNAECPVQIVIAGKAHPRDREGKEILRNIISTIKEDDFRDKVVFIENYDMRTAAYMVQGVDIWVNTPRRPREASGTSGMKAAANGALNLSILDGWWDEAYEMNPNIGWAIGQGEENYAGEDEQDRIEAEELYHLLENHVVPLFFRRGGGNIPREWVSMMKTSMKEVCPMFNTNRMVREYLEKYYVPALQRWLVIGNDGGKAAKEFSTWRAKVQENWNSVEIVAVESDWDTDIEIDTRVQVRAKIKLGKLAPTDVNVQACYGALDENGLLKDPKILPMTPKIDPAAGVTFYDTELKVDRSGQLGFTVRVLPSHPLLDHPAEIGLVTWYNPR